MPSPALVLVGVTGHRDLRARDIPALEAAVKEQLLWVRSRYPQAPLRMLSGLAAGADQLCARVALALGIGLTAVLPWPAEVFRRDFAGEELAAFDALLAASETIVVAPPAEEPQQSTPDYAYRQVGLYIARHSRVLLALWDGSPPRPEGCGTAETVGFMLNRGYPEGEDIAVIQILTPRESSPEVAGVGEVRLLEAERGQG